jgi:hypothetical protein
MSLELQGCYRSRVFNKTPLEINDLLSPRSVYSQCGDDSQNTTSIIQTGPGEEATNVQRVGNAGETDEWGGDGETMNDYDSSYFVTGTM